MEGEYTYITYYLICTLTLYTFTLMTPEMCDSNMLSIPVVLAALPTQTLHAMTGNLLGDGSIRYPNFGRDNRASGNARYEMTMGAAALGYMTILYDTIYANYSSSSLKP